VLLVILIFLMITTTYSKFSEMEISLPQATSGKPIEHPNVINILVSTAGAYKVNGLSVEPSTAEGLGSALRSAASDRPDPVIVINADADATHQAVIRVMEAARLAGYNHITFTTENAR
jgi:biopolymer transport protein ExbD